MSAFCDVRGCSTRATYVTVLVSDLRGTYALVLCSDHRKALDFLPRSRGLERFPLDEYTSASPSASGRAR